MIDRRCTAGVAAQRPCWATPRIQCSRFLRKARPWRSRSAAVLADALVHVTGGTAAAMRHYENQRRRRTARVQAAARTNGQMYHLSGPAALVRDLALRTILGGELMLRRYDWIYDWRPPGPLPARS